MSDAMRIVREQLERERHCRCDRPCGDCDYSNALTALASLESQVRAEAMEEAAQEMECLAEEIGTAAERGPPPGFTPEQHGIHWRAQAVVLNAAANEIRARKEER